jgi:hypothetical protein
MAVRQYAGPLDVERLVRWVATVKLLSRIAILKGAQMMARGPRFGGDNGGVHIDLSNCWDLTARALIGVIGPHWEV